jgi:hypothetical protein
MLPGTARATLSNMLAPNSAGAAYVARPVIAATEWSHSPIQAPKSHSFAAALNSN